MIVGEASATVKASPQQVIDFVLDLERYSEADLKIGKVKRVERDGDRGVVEFQGKVKGLPGPGGVYPFTVTATGLRFGSPVGGPARLFMGFEGTFDCEETPDGTVVRHREVFMFKRPWRWIAEPLLRRWLEADTADEMVRLKKLVEE